MAKTDVKVIDPAETIALRNLAWEVGRELTRVGNFIHAGQGMTATEFAKKMKPKVEELFERMGIK